MGYLKLREDAYRELAEQHPDVLTVECEVCAVGVGRDGRLYVVQADQTVMTVPCPAECGDGRRALTLEELLERLADLGCQPAVMRNDADGFTAGEPKVDRRALKLEPW